MEHLLDNTRGIGFGLLFLFSVIKIFSRDYNVEFRQRFCLLILIHYLCYPSFKCEVLNICFELKFSLWICSHNYKVYKNDKNKRKVWHILNYVLMEILQQSTAFIQKAGTMGKSEFLLCCQPYLWFFEHHILHVGNMSVSTNNSLLHLNLTFILSGLSGTTKQGCGTSSESTLVPPYGLCSINKLLGRKVWNV